MNAIRESGDEKVEDGTNEGADLMQDFRAKMKKETYRILICWSCTISRQVGDDIDICNDDR